MNKLTDYFKDMKMKMYCDKNHIVGKDEDGWYVGEMLGDIVRNKHRLSFEKAIELIIRWGHSEEKS